MRVFVYDTLCDPDPPAAHDEFECEYEGQATLARLHRVEGAYPTLPAARSTGVS